MSGHKFKALNTFIIISFLLLGSANLYADEILVSAAISLKHAFTGVAKKYEKEYPGEMVRFNFASSGQLKKQIEEGAKVDVFASASVDELDELSEKGLLINDTRRTFAGNSLYVITIRKIKGIGDLAGDDVSKIAIGNPKTVPVGKYAKEALINSGLYDEVKDKLVYAENSRQVFYYVLRHVVDTALVYKTDVDMFGGDAVDALRVDKALHKMITYPVSAIKGTNKEKSAKLFIDFLTSEKAKRTFAIDGFVTP
jgi:molybdate transport system substrate-binding protein